MKENLPNPVFEKLEREIIGEWVKRFLAEEKKPKGIGSPTVYVVDAAALTKELRKSANDEMDRTG